MIRRIHRRLFAIGTATCSLAGVLVAVAPSPAHAGGTLVTFNYTGAAQTWTIPTGVQSVWVSMAGGRGSSDDGDLVAMDSTQLVGALTMPSGATTLEINVGGDGAVSPEDGSAGTGGWNGGAAGGTGYQYADGYGGGGGGGASDIRLPGALANQALIVAGGAGGAGGGTSLNDGGSGGSGGLTPQSGSAGPGTDGGSAGLTTNVAGTAATSGGNHETGSSNGGGGGGGGGWSGGGGGGAGQADLVSTRKGSGGGGAGGLSYGNPTYTTGLADNGTNNPGINITYLVVTSGALPSLTVGSFATWAYSANASDVSYALASGSLPNGMWLDGKSGKVKGTPSAVGSFTFTVAATMYPDGSSAVTTNTTTTVSVSAGTGASLTTFNASNIASNSATGNGYLENGGYAITNIACVVSTTNAVPVVGGTTVAASQTSAPANISTYGFTCPFTGLLSNTTYYYYISATQNGSTLLSATNQSFTTNSAPASVITSPATGVTQTSATGNGSITATQSVTSIVCRAATSASGVSTGTSFTASPASISGAFTGRPVTCPMTGLSANTRYFYAFYATDASFTSTSTTPGTFITHQEPPSVSTIAASSITAASARVTGQVTAMNEAVTSIYCRYLRSPGNVDTGTAITASPFRLGATATDRSVTCSLSGLDAATTYLVRLYATDSDGTSASGNVVSLTTARGGNGPAPTPDPEPTIKPTPANNPTTTPAPTRPPEPEKVLPGLFVVPPDSGERIVPRIVTQPPRPSRKNAPVKELWLGVPTALTLQGLPDGQAARVSIVQGDRKQGWQSLGQIPVTRSGKAVLPALLSERPVNWTLRITVRDKPPRYLLLRTVG